MQTINRRVLLKAGASAALTAGVACPLLAATQARTKLGVHLPIWHAGNVDPNHIWPTIFEELAAYNIKHCMIMVYRFIDPITGKISSKSQFTKNQAPSFKFLSTGLKYAVEHGFTTSLYPMLEIDNNKNIGAVWRGYLNFFGVTLENFFTQYQRYLLSLTEIATSANADTLYIGSEAASLTHNNVAHPHWDQLIYDLRSAIKQSQHPNLKLSYAAHWESYATIPFWRQLDDISINAYFPLATAIDARGRQKPTANQVKQILTTKLRELNQFAQSQHRPLIISEFGLTPFDLTTTTPWSPSPSKINDPDERLTTFKALFEILTTKPDNMSTLYLWHWHLPGCTGSPYNINANTPLANLIKSYISAPR